MSGHTSKAEKRTVEHYVARYGGRVQGKTLQLPKATIEEAERLNEAFRKNFPIEIDYRQLEERVLANQAWPSPEVKKDYYRHIYSTKPDPIILTREEFEKLYIGQFRPLDETGEGRKPERDGREKERRDTRSPLDPILD